MTVDLLCRVVDNYGDIGVVYRLAKALSALRPDVRLRLVIDRLDVFAELLPALQPELSLQSLGRWTICHWDHPAVCFETERPRLVIEAFACGRPAWYEALLHDKADPASRLHLVLEYLSAESYAAELHLLPSLSPLAQVKKIYFMPGFSAGTGGLVHDAAFLAACRRWDTLNAGSASRRQTALEALLAAYGRGPLPADIGQAWWLCLFSYEHDYRSLVADLQVWQAETGQALWVMVAAGRSQAGFRAVWEAAERPFNVLFLPFLNQEDWDQVMLASDCLIIRGEESLARAALAGRPFIWHAYLQDEGYQEVKVAALVEALVPHLAKGPAVRAWRELMVSFNQRTLNSAERPARDPWLAFFRCQNELRPGFQQFAKMLENHGDCAAKVLSLMDDFG